MMMMHIHYFNVSDFMCYPLTILAHTYIRVHTQSMSYFLNNTSTIIIVNFTKCNFATNDKLAMKMLTTNVVRYNSLDLPCPGPLWLVFNDFIKGDVPTLGVGSTPARFFSLVCVCCCGFA